jgi:hypothetical protein
MAGAPHRARQLAGPHGVAGDHIVFTQLGFLCQV